VLSSLPFKVGTRRRHVLGLCLSLGRHFVASLDPMKGA